MTENPQPPKRGGLAWQKARRVWGIGDRVKGFADWPDSFTPAELASLQYPREGTDPEKRKALSNQRAMIAEMDSATQAGEMESIILQREIFKTESGRFPGMELAGQWIPSSSYSRKVSAGIKEYRAITRPTFAAWLRASNFGDNEGQEKPSEHVRAWLGNVLQATPEHPTATIKAGGNTDKIPGTLPPRAAGKLAIKAAWLIECETKRRASAKEVMSLLQKWADSGEEPAVLVKSLPAKRAVQWLTTKGKHLEYTLEACEKTLEKWAESQK